MSANIDIERAMSAGINKVWQAWTDPVLILQWIGSDPNGRGLKAELDVRPGGHFSITFRNSDETEFTCYGIYDTVNEFNTLSFSWAWENEPGFESFVTVGLTPFGDNTTKMKFTHAGLWEGSAHDYLEGWGSTFEKLERVLVNLCNGLLVQT